MLCAIGDEAQWNVMLSEMLTVSLYISHTNECSYYTFQGFVNPFAAATLKKKKLGSCYFMTHSVQRRRHCHK